MLDEIDYTDTPAASASLQELREIGNSKAIFVSDPPGNRSNWTDE